MAWQTKTEDKKELNYGLDAKSAEAGALWDIFRRQDDPKPEEYLIKHHTEFRHIYCRPVPKEGISIYLIPSLMACVSGHTSSCLMLHMDNGRESHHRRDSPVHLLIYHDHLMEISTLGSLTELGRDHSFLHQWQKGSIDKLCLCPWLPHLMEITMSRGNSSCFKDLVLV